MASHVRRLRRTLTTIATVVGLVLLIVSLALLAETAHNSLEFSRFQLVILAVNLIGLVVMSMLIVVALARLGRDYLRQVPGARLKARMVSIFAVLALLPVLLVFVFSLQFITRGIDSWFDEDVEAGLAQALSLSRQALDARKREFLTVTVDMGRALGKEDDIALYARLDELRAMHGATELTVFGPNQRIIALSAALPATAETPMPDADRVLPPLQPDEPYVAVEPLPSGGLQVRTALLIESAVGENRVLQGVFPVSERFADLAETIQGAYNAYGRSAYLRKPLQDSFALTLTLVLLLSVLAAVWGAIFAVRRLVAPLQDLIAGTRAVAQGDFSRKLPVPVRDDIGRLVEAFNDMTVRLGRAREMAQQSQQDVERERAKLGTILASLSTGVIALEPDGTIRVANRAAEQILGTALPAGRSLASAPDDPVTLQQFSHAVGEHLEGGQFDWREQVVLPADRGSRVLICACAQLPGEEVGDFGSVLVFDEVTGLLEAQRDAAWGEVARRLAHEIKNPLTPIRLSAERLRRRYLERMPEKDAAVLDRATHTIIQQVEAMRSMVNAFRDYARTPELSMAVIDLNHLVREVVELYRLREAGGVRLVLDVGDEARCVEADANRLRQVLHNLIANAIEAIDERAEGLVRISTSPLQQQGYDYVELRVEDNGHGFQLPGIARVFEPYVTTKEKGTGLGLAIVRKIVEEHHGAIDLGDLPGGAGAWVSIRLPRDAQARAHSVALAAARADRGRSRHRLGDGDEPPMVPVPELQVEAAAPHHTSAAVVRLPSAITGENQEGA
jgi:nitrogen fixation/metabolism regulation signal transduction histidine kinase